ncbi:hypothetical protein K0T92_01545 [Paenibacillus oenotherae]|uniref:Helicase XPB/Ssl2 N-terminal domain-containing protein n=1 Tax=Paenibacillus oenotherae TaxID=1435645 RepID=A0ABS7D0G7_9BACL|nr:hypothetical protein [Paenibacillus oenotherae]MBW7473425.1 hypothetical protein [Paenibacillus oenotherae]
MNLADMLSYTDIGQLSRIATAYRCECNGNSKNDLIQSILSTITRRDVFESQVGAMGLEDLRFMNSLLFDPRDSFSLEELLARVQQSKFSSPEQASSSQSADNGQMTNAAAAPVVKRNAKRAKTAKEHAMPESGPRATISRFKQYGWLFNGYAGSDRYLFQIPKDLKDRFKETLERKLAAQVAIIRDEPDAYRDEQGLLGEDVAELLTYVHHNEIQLTAEGIMYKRNVQQLLERLGVQEQLPGRGEWRFGYGRHINEYPNRMSLLYDYCFYNGWLSESGAMLTLTAAGMERQAVRVAEAPDKLYRFWLRLYKGAMPNIRAITHWVGRLSQHWVSSDTLKGALLPYIKPFYYDQPETIFDQRLIAMMMHLGLLRIGEHAEQGGVIRMTPLGRSIVAGFNIDDDAIVLHTPISEYEN